MMSTTQAKDLNIFKDYSFTTITKSLKNTLNNPALYRSITQQLSNADLQVTVPRIRPIWISLLTDTLTGKSTSSYSQYSDYSDIHQRFLSRFATPINLERNQSIILFAVSGKYKIQIETVTIDETGVERKVNRVRTEVNDSLTQNAVCKYVDAALESFLPTMISSFVRCVSDNRVDVTKIPDSDVRFSDYLGFNLYGSSGVTKALFVKQAKPIDIFHAFTYHPNPVMNPCSPLALQTLALTCSNIGSQLIHAPVMDDRSLIGSSIVSVLNGTITKRPLLQTGVASSEPKSVSIKLFGTSSGYDFEDLSDHFNQAATINHPTSASIHHTPPATSHISDDEDGPSPI